MPPALNTLPRIIVHTSNQAEAALAAAREAERQIILQSPARCACIQGAAWFRKLIETARAQVPDIEAHAVLDCADAPGLALAALRDGAEAVRLDPDLPAWSAIADIATQYGAWLDDGATPLALDLLDARDPLEACRQFLRNGLGLEP